MERMTPLPGERHDDITNEINLIGAIVVAAAKERFADKKRNPTDKFNLGWCHLSKEEQRQAILDALAWLADAPPLTDEEWDTFVASAKHAKDATYRQQSKAERKRLGVDA